MASNKRMIDIEKEINDFFASDEFKKLTLSYDGVYRDYCNPEKFRMFDDTPIEPICRSINEKIREIIDNTAINMFIRNNRIYIESDFPFGRKRDIQIGRLIITECGFGGRKDNWIFRFNNEYAYYTFQVHDGEEIRHYRILDVKEKISDMYRKDSEGREVLKLDNNVLGIRKIDSPDELIYMPLGSKIKVIWHKSDCYEEGEECFGVKYGDKVGWEDGSSGELESLISGISNHCCSVYLADDKVLALNHLYQICMKNIEDIQSKTLKKMDDCSYGCILAYTELEHKINELLCPEMY